MRPAAAVLRFPGLPELEDLRTYAERARRADDGGAMRLVASGTTLAAYVGIIAGVGLMGEGTVMGLRVSALAEPAELDVTVPLAAVTDRIARTDALDGAPELPVPPTTVSTAWAALAPPRSGWERVGTLGADELNDVAAQGIREVAEGAPAEAGGHAVTSLRQRVWGRPTPTVPPVPAGGAFAAHVLGFAVPGSEVTVLAHGRWARLTCAGGHVLVR